MNRLRRLTLLVVRPVFLFLVLLLVLLAVIQASGRFTMATLHLYEGELNALLARANVQVQGVRGAWSRLNPIIRVQGLRFPGGDVRDIEIEISLIESVLRSHLIPRRVKVGGADLYLLRDADGWHLRGMPAGESSFDVSALVRPVLRHVDDFKARLALHLQRTDAPATRGSDEGRPGLEQSTRASSRYAAAGHR